MVPIYSITQTLQEYDSTKKNDEFRMMDFLAIHLAFSEGIRNPGEKEM